jgi:hypothetical protein
MSTENFADIKPLKMQEFSWDFMGLLDWGISKVIHCSRSKLLPAVIQRHGFKAIKNSSIFTTQAAMTCDFHHSLTLTKGFLSLAAKTL